MEKFRGTSTCRSAALFLFITSLILLNWPLLSVVADSGVLTVASLFLLWLGIIGCLGIYSHYEAEKPSDCGGEDEPR